MEQDKRKVSEGGALQAVAIIACCLLILAVLEMNDEYRSTHYQQGTTIQGIDCSKLTVEEAEEKIEQREIVLIFSNGKTYSSTAKELGAIIEDTSELEGILTTQKKDKTQLDFILTEKSWSVDRDQVAKFLKGIKELKEGNMRLPKNARLELTSSGNVQIIKEVNGNYIEFEKACDFVVSSLKQSANSIDFSEIMRVIPDVTANDRELMSKAEELNRILGSKITFELRRGETYTLFYGSVLKDWVKVEGEEITIDIDGNLRNFVEGLNAKVQELGETFEFVTPEGEMISVPVKTGKLDEVDIEAEIAQIKAELERGENTARAPIYAHWNSIDSEGDYILVSLTNQWVKMYKDGKFLIGGPCVTGTANTERATPTGFFYPEYFQRGKYFKKYGGYSEYWIPLENGDGIGLHDAGWRTDNENYTEFVPETYLTDGSHGCINMQLKIVKVIFENATEATPVLIH